MNRKVLIYGKRTRHIKRICQIYEMADLGATKKLLTTLFRIDCAMEASLQLKKAKFRSGASWVSAGRTRRLHANIIYYYYCNCSPENIDFHRAVNLDELIAVARLYKINFNNELADINRIHSMFVALFNGEIITARCDKCGLNHIYNDAYTYNYKTCPFCMGGSKANYKEKKFLPFD